MIKQTIIMAALCPSFGVSAGAPSIIDLQGSWRFSLDPQDAGIRDRWAARPERFNDSIPLPGTTDLAGKGTHRTEAAPFAYYLTREWEYVGPAWYARAIEVPPLRPGHSLELFLERVMWQSRVWIDGREVGTADSLSTPHVHDLGSLTPGRHWLVVRIDNRMIHPIGDKSHGYGDQTQSRWNGIVGKIELRQRPPVAITLARLFSEADGSLRLEVTGRSRRTDEAGFTVEAAAGGGSDEAAWREHSPGFVVAPGTGFRQELTIRPQDPLSRWNEFHPGTRPLTVRLREIDGGVVDETTIPLAPRLVGRTAHHITLDGRPIFLRGNLECAVFPKTGHPPTDVESWRRIWRIYHEYGLNHARFHSWCPPDAAFAAADEEGIYLQVEAPVWMDNWMRNPNPRPEMNTEGYPQGPGRNDRTNDVFIRAEIRRIVDTYGHHPSFILFCIGNELGPSEFTVTGRWMAEEKAHDPRRLYAASTARTITPHCEFNATHSVPGIGSVRQHLEPGTNWDYEGQYGRASVPIIAHEIGQWPIYVDWENDLPKFTGPLKPYRLQTMAKEAEQSGLAGQAKDLCAASGAVNRLLYRDEIESFLRTPSCGGFQLLGMQDFTGQGEAMVGWLDAFYESKGSTEPATFRRWCGPTVLLARIPRYVWSVGEELQTTVLVHHYGEKDLPDLTVDWWLETTDGRPLARGSCAPQTVRVGSLATLGEIRLVLPALSAATAARLVLRSREGALVNSYPLWIYPQKEITVAPAGITVTETWDQAAKKALAAGGRVVLLASGLGDATSARHASWLPLYWSVPFFPGQSQDTLGLLVDPTHPALSGFPTEGFNDWQWWRICAGARGFDLTGKVPAGWHPVAQPVSDFHLNRKLASLFECRVGNGRLLVCGYDLGEERCAGHPEVACLRTHLLAYAASEKFHPSLAFDEGTLDALFPPPAGMLRKAPAGFEKADLYVQAAARLTTRSRSVPWKVAQDNVPAQHEGVDYRIEADGSWCDESASAWHGKRLRVVIRARAGVPCTLHVRFHDWNHNGRTGTVAFEGEKRDLGPHTDGVWVKFDVIREHTNDGQLVLECEAATGPNLQITDLALVPKE